MPERQPRASYPIPKCYQPDMIAHRRIYITGASCSGVTTLGRTLAHRLAVQHLDVDDFYWMPSNPPFTTKRAPEERVRLIRQRQGDDGWVLTGSFDGWGDALIDEADLIVFVYAPTSVRLERLQAREKERFGDRIIPGGICTRRTRHFANGPHAMTIRRSPDATAPGMKPGSQLRRSPSFAWTGRGRPTTSRRR